MRPTTPQSVKKYQKTARMLRDIETELNSLLKHPMTAEMRRKVRELQRIHADLKRTYEAYTNLAVKKDVDRMFQRVLKKTRG